jgi:hypothetical protein
LAALKVFILMVTFSYIYSKLTTSDGLQLERFTQLLKNREGNIFSLVTFLVLALANWFFEILKWKTIVSIIAPLTFTTAMRQSLAALTVSLATPNRIGDYGAKAMFFQVEKRKQILLLNFFSNSLQMAVTCFFGIIGLMFVVMEFGISFSITKMMLFLISIVCLGYLGYYFKEKQLILKGLSVSKVIQYFRNIARETKLKIFMFSIFRYLIFSYLFYIILLFFGASLPFFEGILIIFSMYLLVSLIPTIFIFDVLVRGGVAVWLFSMAGVPELVVLSTVLSMWLLNFVGPAIWGSFYVITFKPIGK